jgi:2-(3-amino-3-carboxypropyl)histidine synthase
MFTDYDFELENICKTILKKKYGTVGLQFPEGLKRYAGRIAEHIERNCDVQVIISAEPCYGACDLDSGMGIDLLVHFGHSSIPSIKIDKPVLFIEVRSNLDVLKVVDKASRSLKGKLGLVTTVQHIDHLSIISTFLKKKGIGTVIGKGDDRIAYDGQVLGCNFSSATSILNEVDAYLFIGSGNFHPLGVALTTQKEVIAADPYSNEVRDIKKIKEKILRQRFGAIVRAENAKNFGILVGTKIGQRRWALARELNKLIKDHGKKALFLTMGNFDPSYLKSFDVDAWVSTACPRIAIDNYMRYEIPILTPVELKIVLNEMKWEEYKFDEILEPCEI